MQEQLLGALQEERQVLLFGWYQVLLFGWRQVLLSGWRQVLQEIGSRSKQNPRHQEY